MSQTKPIHVLGISGSLRRASFNSGLLRAAADLLPEGMSLEIFDLASIPLYNADGDGGAAPEPVRHFKARIAAADALLIATPEYNHSIPGVLKNAIDWASRPPKDSPFNDKPLAIMGAGGGSGTIRAQAHLRQIAAGLNMLALNRPSLFIRQSWEKFDPASGDLHDEATRESVRALLEALAVWTRRLQSAA